MPLSTPALIVVILMVLSVFVFLFTYYRKRNRRDLKEIEAELNREENQHRR